MAGVKRGGSSSQGKTAQKEVKLIGSKNDPELTDSIEDYFLPQATREHLENIKSLKSYSDFENYFADQGIELDTGLDVLKLDKRNDDIPAVRETGQKLAVAIDAYKETFGPNALSKLNRIVLYDKDLDVTAAYFFNQIGEHDPQAGSIHLRNWNNTGRVIFHELAHAYQDSQARKGEDAISYSNRMTKQAKLNPKFRAYFGAKNSALEAERFADAFGFGFSLGSNDGMRFIQNVVKQRKR